MDTVAILCAGGLGDGLLMMVAAHRFMQKGCKVTFYHDQHAVLAPLFPGCSMSSYPEFSQFYESFKSYDLILIQNDHSARAWRVIHLREKNLLPQAVFLFPTVCKAATGKDFTFNPKIPFLINLKRFLEVYFHESIELDNGLSVQANKKKANLIVIHPTSKDPLRNWPQMQYCRLADKLIAKGYEVLFMMSASERKIWTKGLDDPLVPLLNSFQEMAETLSEASFFIGNDSGLGHLASNLHIPTLTISGNPKRIALWRPAWALSQVVTIPFELPNFKGIHLRLRDHLWQHFIPVGRVEKAFNTLSNITKGSF